MKRPTARRRRAAAKAPETLYVRSDEWSRAGMLRRPSGSLRAREMVAITSPDGFMLEDGECTVAEYKLVDVKRITFTRNVESVRP